MSVVKAFGMAVVLAGCAASPDDASPRESASTSKSELTDDGIGRDVPAPTPIGVPMPWDDPKWKPPMPRHDPDELDPVGPEGLCGIGWKSLYDPARGKKVQVPIVVCGG